MVTAGDPLTEFRTRLLADWLPTFCKAYEGCSPDGLKEESVSKLSAFDAYWFLKALERQLVIAHPDGSFTAPRSKAKEYILWNTDKHTTPRPLSLGLEPIITIGALARLHELYSWPKEHLGMQSADWAYDLVCYAADTNKAVIFAEVKKSEKEVEFLVRMMTTFSRTIPLAVEPTRAAEKNAYRKVASIRRNWPERIWVVGPNGTEHIFRVLPDGVDGTFDLAAASPDALQHTVATT